MDCAESDMRFTQNCSFGTFEILYRVLSFLQAFWNTSWHTFEGVAQVGCVNALWRAQLACRMGRTGSGRNLVPSCILVPVLWVTLLACIGTIRMRPTGFVRRNLNACLFAATPTRRKTLR